MSEPVEDPVRDLNEIGQLAAGVSHHVINAFAAIVSNAEILRLVGAGSAPRSLDPVTLSETIIRTAIEASGVARRLIDYSRPATTPGTERMALDRVVAEAVERERGRHHPGDSGIDWVLDLHAVPLMRGNPTQIGHMLGLLIANAREAMPSGGGAITISTSLDDRGWIVLEVRDNGKGMAASELDRAVEPFFTTKPGHLGVGLSIANGIWRRHHGTMAIRSQSGDGTRVRLCIEPGPEPN
jgi:two-component system sensor kinase FixL